MFVCPNILIPNKHRITMNLKYEKSYILQVRQMHMNNHITTYTMVAVAVAMIGLVFLGTGSSPSNTIYAQQLYEKNTTGMYCNAGDYLCHDKLGKEQLDANNTMQARNHYELAAGNAIAYPEIAKHFEQLVSALKADNTTDAEDHLEQAHSVIEKEVGQ
jgi:hypothetical protein